MNYKRYLKNIPEVFGKIFDALSALFKKPENDPAKIAAIKEFKVTSVEIPEEFLPFIAYELGCLYDWQYWGGLSRERIVKFRKLRELEGTTPGLVKAVQVMDTRIYPESVVFTRTGGCTGTLNAVLKNVVDNVNNVVVEWRKIDWQYLFYLICDYKRASLWLTLLLERILGNQCIFLGAGIRNDRITEYPVQPFAWGHASYIGAGIRNDRIIEYTVQPVAWGHAFYIGSGTRNDRVSEYPTQIITY